MSIQCSKCGEALIEGIDTCFNCPPSKDDLEEMELLSMNGCVKCGTLVNLTWHEPIMGHKCRKLSQMYDLKVRACWECHEYIQNEPTQEFNKMLQKRMQRKFKLLNKDLDFLKIFHRNYLTEEDE